MDLALQLADGVHPVAFSDHIHTNAEEINVHMTDFHNQMRLLMKILESRGMHELKALFESNVLPFKNCPQYTAIKIRNYLTIPDNWSTKPWYPGVEYVFQVLHVDSADAISELRYAWTITN